MLYCARPGCSGSFEMSFPSAQTKMNNERNKQSTSCISVLNIVETQFYEIEGVHKIIQKTKNVKMKTYVLNELSN